MDDSHQDTVGSGEGNVENAGRSYGRRPRAYRLPDALRLGSVHLQVANLQRSVDYYERVLGLSAISRGDAEVSLGPVGAADPIVVLRERKGATPVPRHGRLGLYHFAILLPDRPSLGRFVDHLGRNSIRAGASNHLVSEALYLTDPDGLGIEVYADRPRSSWRVDGEQLMMDSRPLDLADLVRAAGGELWSGMPAGTKLGHVHLHVGDIGAAEGFYHEGLGFDKIVWSYPGALFLSAGGYHHHLGVNTWAGGAPPAGEGEARLLEWEIVVPSRNDVGSALANLEAKGYPIERAGDGGLVRDPWGTAVRVLPEWRASN